MIRLSKLTIAFYLAGVVPMVHAQLPDHYAESTMLFALSADGEQEISLRLARFPLTGKATVWFHLADGEHAWAMAHETFVASDQATQVHDDVVSFAALHDAQYVQFESRNRNSQRMYGEVSAQLYAVATRHPQLGEGSIPVSIELRYESTSPGFRAASGRWEMTGAVSGTVTVQDNIIAFDHPGKWHEQTGPRAQFAPAFTYFNVQNEALALLAIAFADRVNGYGMIAGELHTLQSFEIDPPQTAPRRFTAQLYNPETGLAQRIEGSAQVVQQWSVPIEGQRRPGTAVVVDTSIGKMFGSLNDWQPAP